MHIPLVDPQVIDELYLAGERAPAGLYRRVESDFMLQIEEGDILPGSLDGRVACYHQVRYAWGHPQGDPRLPVVQRSDAWEKLVEA